MALAFSDFIGQASSGDYRHGLGCQRCGPDCRCGLGATTVHGNNLEPGDYGYKQTTRPGQTVSGHRQGLAPVGRRIALTNMINELEFLAGTPGVHPRVLAQKVWTARRALMGTSRWEFASYKSPSRAYDSYAGLASRLKSVELVLGVAGVSAKASGMGGLGSYGSTGAFRGAPWGATGGSPISKLASCIRGAMCMPKSFCCPAGQQFEDPYYDDFPEFEDFPPEEDFPEFYGQGGGGGGGGDKGGTWIGMTCRR